MVKDVTSTKEVDSELYPMIQDIHALLNQHLSWKVQFDFRETNIVAHNLTQLVCTLQGDSIWMEECPVLFMSWVMENANYITYQ